MRYLLAALITVATTIGCQGSYDYPGPKVDNFDGQLVAGGKPVQFEPDQKVTLRLMFHGTGESYGIPIQPDGTFDIGWMPIGEYSAVLEYTKVLKGGKGASGRPEKRPVSGGLVIEEGKTVYELDLGSNFKP